MSIYNNDDIKLLQENLSLLDNVIEQRKTELYEPSKKEKDEVSKIILDFIKKNKRKIYGGYAINKLVAEKDPKDAFYKEYQTPDIDFYSPTPIEDLINLCNILFEAGHKRVSGQEAQHKDTYSIFVNFNLYCDISYVPRNIYNRLPFKEINGVYYTHPHFITIDYLRMITDPLESYWRIDKSVKRFSLLQKHFPLPTIDKPIKIVDSTPELETAVNKVINFLNNKKTCITIGFYAYNQFINASEIKNKNIKTIKVPYVEFISTQYKDDFKELMAELIKEFPASKITHKEFFPFFQFTGYSVEIYLDGELIAIIYTDNKKCYPFVKVNSLEFDNDKVKKIKGEMIIGSFSLTLLYAQIQVIKFRTINDEDMRNVYMTLVSHLLSCKKEFFKKNKKTLLDDTIFKDFVVDCMGYTVDPKRERQLLLESRKNKGKRIIFRYEPSKDVKEADTTFKFGNYSGNEIKNNRNSQLIDKASKSDEDEVEDEVEEEPESDETKS